MEISSAEIERVTHHIERAEGHAARRDVSGLGHLQRLLRRLLLKELADYREAGRFPINRDFRERTPYFVDASGTRCAMAHLLELGGEGTLVEQIARERNNARIRELVDEPRLLAWLEAAGLTVAEAAAIQPTYCAEVTTCVCGGGFTFVDYPVPAAGVLEGVVLANGMARIERTYGDSFGIQIGSEVPLSSFGALRFVEGMRILAPINSATTDGHGAIALDADGLYACIGPDNTPLPALDTDQFVEAVMAADCAAHLRASDSAWREKQGCEGGVVNGPFGGCSAGPELDAMSVGILLAVVAAIVQRRRS